jgi:hypothetical protein
LILIPVGALAAALADRGRAAKVAAANAPMSKLPVSDKTPFRRTKGSTVSNVF